MNRSILKVVAAASAMTLALSACGSDGGDGDAASEGGGGDDATPIKIGVIADLTGATGDVGTPYNEGMMAYIDYRNADGGIDGLLYFRPDGQRPEKALISVKGGQNVSVTMIRDLHSAMERERAPIGIFITAASPAQIGADCEVPPPTTCWPLKMIRTPVNGSATAETSGVNRRVGS